MPDSKPAAYIFDAYGTLFDVHSVVLRAGQGIAGDLWSLSQLWRQKQVEFTWRRTLMQRYQDFWQVTEEALRWSAVQLAIGLSESQIEGLMQAYLSPAVFPEVQATLEALKGSPLAILSNGTPAMLEGAVRAGGLESYFSHVISVDQIKAYKPSPAVYALGAEKLNIPADQSLFISANAWDAAGAKSYGYRVCWCNRSGAVMDVLGFAPDLIVQRLDEIVEHALGVPRPQSCGRT
jgi:2-haloacid dehalogenase